VVNVGFWTGKRVVVTGGAGFLGSYVLDGLARRGVTGAFVPRAKDFDLVDGEAVRRLYREAKPHVVLHLAAVVGGIGANQDNPGRFFHDNLMMGVQLIEEGRKAGVQKFVALGTVCAYPKFTPVPFREDDLWNGYPEETNAPYGVAKKALLVQCQAYRAQYGFNGIFLLPVNLYGPRDHFDPRLSHVIPALIKKVVDAQAAGAKEIVCWGDGTPTREFLHAEDAAEGILLAAERYDGELPVNLGSGDEHSIADLARLIAQACGFQGALRWDTSKPNGQPRRKLDTSRAQALFGFTAKKPFAQGLRETVDWYRKARTEGNAE
jgi:GDP-L-fucose synthase